MPAKKTATSEAGEGKFVWEGANENKLLLIILGRHVQTSEFEEIALAFPGATSGAIRNRLGVLRAKQKKLYEDLGWSLPSGAAGSAKKARATPSKRASDEDVEVKTPSKKPRVSRKEVKSQTPEASAGDGGEGEGVKVEMEEG